LQTCHVRGDEHCRFCPRASRQIVCLSSIPKGSWQEALLYFNRDGYSTYCKEYREYWDWEEKRNDARYENTQSHGKNYDAKNMKWKKLLKNHHSPKNPTST